MTTYRTVLLAYDGSDTGRRALLEGAHMLHLCQAKLHLLAVAPIAAGIYLTEGYIPDTLQEEENKHFGEILDEGLAQLRARGIEAVGHLSTGEPVEEISRLAREISADLIVVGHQRHRTLLERWWKGSVGASLIEAAPCSVLIAIEAEREETV